MNVLTHPGHYKLDEPQPYALLTAFRDAGGTAMELVTGSHTADRFEIYARYAQRYGLLASAGSYFQGPGDNRRDFGNLPDLLSGGVPIWSSW